MQAPAGDKTQGLDLNALLTQALLANQGINTNIPVDVVNALLSSLAKGESSTFKIGDQVISLKIDKPADTQTENQTNQSPTKEKSENKENSENTQAKEEEIKSPSETVRKSLTTIAEETSLEKNISAEGKEFSFNVMKESLEVKKDSTNTGTDESLKLQSMARSSEIDQPIIKEEDITSPKNFQNDAQDANHISFDSSSSVINHLIDQQNRNHDESKPVEPNSEAWLQSPTNLDMMNASIILKRGDTAVSEDPLKELPELKTKIPTLDMKSPDFDDHGIAETTSETKEIIGEPEKKKYSDSSVDSEEARDDFKEIEQVLDPNNPYYQFFNKYLERLKKKERKLRQKEKDIENKINEFEKNSQTSFSSTQMSEETVSTGFNKVPKDLEQIINGILSDTVVDNSPSIQHQNFDPQLHFAFLFSAPLVLYYADAQQNIKKSPIYVEVDYRSELATVKRILGTSRNEVKFRSFVATQSGLGECLNMKPRCIHFCGHGVKNNQENFGLFTKNGEGDFLLFEDEEGKADFMSCRSLKNLLKEKKLDQSIDFVFVASCHSSLVGEVFKDAGAKHVICVRRDEKILEQACQEFTKHFYQAYFGGNYTVCEAFRNAKEHLKSIKGLPAGEANKFINLVDESIFQQHTCSSMFPQSKNTGDQNVKLFKDLTPVPPFNKIPSRVEHFVGRHIELHELIRLIRKQRFVTIKGIPGIGKSSLCKELANYFYERNVFQDGIIYLSLNGCDSIEGLISGLDSKLGYLSKKVDSKKEGVGYLICQVANNLAEKFENGLLILDNVDQVQHNERAKFREFIEMILVTCSKLKILITSRSPIGGGFQDAVEKVYALTHLDPANARELFLSKAPRQITENEIKEFLEFKLSSSEMDLFYNGHLFDQLRQSRTNMSNNNNGLHSELCTPNLHNNSNVFEGHHLMQLLGGHPQAISLAAALLVEERSLKDLYKLLLEHPILDVLKVEDMTEDEVQSMNSMQVSLDVSINYLSKRHKDTVRFFGLLGLLPGGAEEADLEPIWGKGWLDHISLLLRYSLTIKHISSSTGIHRYTLYPFMMKYAEERLATRDHAEFSRKILLRLRAKAKEVFAKIGNVQQDSHIFFDLFLQEEPNIKACIKRAVDAIDKKKVEIPSEELEPDSERFSLIKGNLEMFTKVSTEKHAVKPERPRKISSEFEEQNTGKIVVSENVAQLLGGLRNSQVSNTLTSEPENKETELSVILEKKESENVPPPMTQSFPAPNLGKTSSYDSNLIKKNRDKSNESQAKTPDVLNASFDPATHYHTPIRGRPSLLPRRGEDTTDHDSSRTPPPKSEDLGKSDDQTVYSNSVTFQNTDASQHTLSRNLSQNISQNVSTELVNESIQADHSQELTMESNENKGRASLRNSPMKPEIELDAPEFQLTSNYIPTPKFISIDDNNPEENSAQDPKLKPPPGKFRFSPTHKIPLVLEPEKLIREFSLKETSLKPCGDEIIQEKAERAKTENNTPEKNFDKKLSRETNEETISSENQRNSANSQNTRQSNPMEVSPGSGKNSARDQKLSTQTPNVMETSNTSKNSQELGGTISIQRVSVASKLEDSGEKTKSPVEKQVEAEVASDTPETKIDELIAGQTRVRNSIPSRHSVKDDKKGPKQRSKFNQATIEEVSENTSKVEKEKEKEKDKKPVISKTKPTIPISSKLSNSSKLSGKGDKRSAFPIGSNSSANEPKEKMEASCHLCLLYASILFLLRRFNECDKAISQGILLCLAENDKVSHANFLKLKGCINWIKKNFTQSCKYFVEASELFRETGCSLGIAICDAAIGYLKVNMLDENPNAAIKRLDNALSIYKQLNHIFGVHYLHRWLSGIMNKIPSFKPLSKQHSDDSRKALNSIKQKDICGYKHKGGLFVVRWMGDAFSILLEIAGVIDEKPQKRKPIKDESDSLTNSSLSTSSTLKTLKKSGNSDNQAKRPGTASSSTAMSRSGKGQAKAEPTGGDDEEKPKTAGVHTPQMTRKKEIKIGVMPSLRNKLTKKEQEKNAKKDKTPEKTPERIEKVEKALEEEKKSEKTEDAPKQEEVKPVKEEKTKTIFEVKNKVIGLEDIINRDSVKSKITAVKRTTGSKAVEKTEKKPESGNNSLSNSLKSDLIMPNVSTVFSESMSLNTSIGTRNSINKKPMSASQISKTSAKPVIKEQK